MNIRILNAQGQSVSRDEVASLYASDLAYNPHRRQTTINRDGEITLVTPEGPVILHAKLVLPGFGHLWVTADNGGQGYPEDATLDFVKEAAQSRVLEVERYIEEGGFTPSPHCLSALRDAKTMLRLGESQPAKAAEYHMTALCGALWSGELAAVERARAYIAGAARRDDFLFGCGGFTYPFAERPGHQQLFDATFNYATLPFYLAPLEPEYGKPDYARLDALQDAFEQRGIQTKGHPLWWAHTAGMPKWTENLRWDDGSIQREIDRVVSRSVTRYKGRIRYFDAINESHDWCNAYNLTQRQQAEMTKLCCDAIHSANPDASAVINTCFVFGENAADGRVQWGVVNQRNLTPYTYLELVEELDTQYEAVGLQLYCPNRDMLAIEKMYDRYAGFGKPLHLTELGVPSHPQDVPPNTTEGDIYCLRYMYSGLWHEMQWSERVQADWLEWFYTVSYAHPCVEALTWWSFDDPGYVPAAGLNHPDGTPKEALFRLQALQAQWGFQLGK